MAAPEGYRGQPAHNRDLGVSWKNFAMGGFKPGLFGNFHHLSPMKTAGSRARPQIPFDIARECKRIHSGKSKQRARIIFYARVNTQTDSKAAAATLRYWRML